MADSGDALKAALANASDRVISATLIVPRSITRQLFDDNGKILDRRLDTMQAKCACSFIISRIPHENAGSKVCDRVHIKYNFPTKNHEVTVRLFIDLAQQCSSCLSVLPFIKVCRVERKPLDSVLKEAAERVISETHQQQQRAGINASRGGIGAVDTSDEISKLCKQLSQLTIN